MKKIKLFGIGLFLIMCMSCIGFFSGCGDTPRTDQLHILIKEEYSEKYANREFTLEDFEFSNIKEFFYVDKLVGSQGFSIWLKKAGIIQVNAAKKHLEKLEFVKQASLNKKGSLPECNYNYSVFATVFTGDYLVKAAGINEGTVDLRLIIDGEISLEDLSGLRITYTLEGSTFLVTRHGGILIDINLPNNSRLYMHRPNNDYDYILVFTDGSQNYNQVFSIIRIEIA